MARIEIFLDRSIEENAGIYFEKSKKAKKKLEGAMESVNRTRLELEKAEKKRAQQEASDIVDDTPARKKHWYEKFRWFFSSEGFLVIGGKDAPTNEIIIKKHTEEKDIVFHTDMAGSPFFVIKADSQEKEIGQATMLETADATASYSRAWKMGLASSDVFYVSPDQVSKEAQAGEALARGSFMIYGKTSYIENRLKVAIGLSDEGQIIGGPVSAIKAHSKIVVIVEQGDTKPSDAAKFVKKTLGKGDLDEIIRFLPPGNVKVRKEQ